VSPSPPLPTPGCIYAHRATGDIVRIVGGRRGFVVFSGGTGRQALRPRDFHTQYEKLQVAAAASVTDEQLRRMTASLRLAVFAVRHGWILEIERLDPPARERVRFRHQADALHWFHAVEDLDDVRMLLGSLASSPGGR
jgi:hypothetical protein